MKETHVIRGTLHPAVYEPFELFVGLSATIPGWLCVALGAHCFSGVAVGECFASYAQPAEALAHPFLIRREQGADQLRSAAQAFVVASRGPEACLLRWPSLEWAGAAQDCSGSDPSRLSGGVVGEMAWSLLDWKPSTESGQLKVQLADGRTGSFRLALDPSAASVLGISEVQLQARVPQLEAE